MIPVNKNPVVCITGYSLKPAIIPEFFFATQNSITLPIPLCITAHILPWTFGLRTSQRLITYGMHALNNLYFIFKIVL